VKVPISYIHKEISPNIGLKFGEYKMRFTYDDNTYSDLHKDAYGFRPRNDGWDQLSPVGKQIRWESLCEALDRRMAEDEAAEAAAVERFEARITELEGLGAPDRAAAILWLVESLDLRPHDLAFYGGEIVCFEMGLPYDMQAVFSPACSEIIAYREQERDEPYESYDLSDDGDALASAGMGTDEDYGYYGE
jgi:hypothetical protein